MQAPDRWDFGGQSSGAVGNSATARSRAATARWSPARTVRSARARVWLANARCGGKAGWSAAHAPGPHRAPAPRTGHGWVQGW